MHRTLVSAYTILIGASLAATALCARRAYTVEQQRATAHAAGYRQGLMHAARGLLDPTLSTRVDDNSDNDRNQQ